MGVKTRKPSTPSKRVRAGGDLPGGLNHYLGIIPANRVIWWVGVVHCRVVESTAGEPHGPVRPGLHQFVLCLSVKLLLKFPASVWRVPIATYNPQTRAPMPGRLLLELPVKPSPTVIPVPINLLHCRFAYRA